MASKTITYALQEGNEDIFEIDEEYLAFKDGVCYDVYKSSKCYIYTGLVGTVRMVFDENNFPIAEAPPCMGFNEPDFELVPKKTMEHYSGLKKQFKQKTKTDEMDFQI